MTGFCRRCLKDCMKKQKKNNADIVVGGHREYLQGKEHDYYHHPLEGRTYK